MGLLIVIRNVMTQAIVADPITEAAKMTLRPGEWYASQNTNVAVMLVARPSAMEPVIGKAKPVNSKYGISSHAISQPTNPNTKPASMDMTALATSDTTNISSTFSRIGIMFHFLRALTQELDPILSSRRRVIFPEALGKFHVFGYA